jgi:hypothetical protein
MFVAPRMKPEMSHRETRTVDLSRKREEKGGAEDERGRRCDMALEITSDDRMRLAIGAANPCWFSSH